ncbi:MAG: hypothetical protein O3B01_17600 [Planctomycetota bacterium]|nr:hypothetical protein [Planctomycetota bacterium]MDA1140390.1 hypothetical protein [Planctomycetota bacterium]
MATETVLTTEDHEHFIEHGYVIVRNAVPPETIEPAVKWLEAGKPEGIPGTPEFKSVGGELVQACQTDRMHDAIAELFGPEYPHRRGRGGSEMPRVYQPDAKQPEFRAHVDDSYPGIMPNGWAVGSFTFLTRVRSNGGGFVYFKGSPLRYREALARHCQCAKGNASRLEFSGPGKEFLAEPGDVLLFQQLMGHSGSTNIADPTTRQALLARYHPNRRIVPGLKPFEEMSTIEKAYSARYLADRFGVDIKIPKPTDVPGADSAIGDGFPLAERVLAYAMLHFDSRVNLLFVDASDPSRIRHVSSGDFVTWNEAQPVDIQVGPIQSLQFHHYELTVILSVCAESKTFLFRSDDFKNWEQFSILEGASCATPFFVYPKYPSKVAGGQTVYRVLPSRPWEVLCSWEDKWEDVAETSPGSVAVRVPEGRSIQDISLAAKFADSSCAFVIDVEKEPGDGKTEPWFVLPKDIAVAGEEAEPLPHNCPTPPRYLRVLNRNRNYWLVTFVRQQEGQDCVFWGTIDWEETPMLREVRTAEGLELALCVVGFI